MLQSSAAKGCAFNTFALATRWGQQTDTISFGKLKKGLYLKLQSLQGYILFFPNQEASMSNKGANSICKNVQEERLTPHELQCHVEIFTS